MPATFLYLSLFVIWVIFACLVWLTACLMLLTRRTRVFSRPLCLAMAGTFPFVFAYQIVAAFFVAVLLLTASAFLKILEPRSPAMTQNTLAIVLSMAGALLSFGAMLIMSLAGFCEGWRTGWEYGKGRPFQEVLYETPMVKILSRFLRTARSVAKRSSGSACCS